MSYSVGSMVKARGREWVVLPESSDDLLLLRPLGGTEDEVAGILPSLEMIESASFDLPDPSKVGDAHSCRLLRDAVRLGFRSSAGPFRSFAKVAVEPRPYQLVPLLMALKLDPVRILIADDVGIGKTIEACLIARELLDRGDAHRLAILCPPQLAEQWQAELKEKFHIEAELVLPSTASRLERHCAVGQSLFDIFPHVVVSMDFIKSDRRRDEFLRTCPELVIVDEAHTCANQYEGKGGKHQRHQLLKGLSANEDRHLILVTATPHSGKEDAFRSLLTLLKSDFRNLPEDLSGRENEQQRRQLAQHFVQRRRADILHFLDTETIFPVREESEATYQLSREYKAFFERVLKYAGERVRDPENNRLRQRVRWWSVLALLRCLASSPAAAAATLRSRAGVTEAATEEVADEIGRHTVLDMTDDESAESIDVIPGSDTEGEESKDRRRLLDMAREADALQGDKDDKLLKAVKIIQKLVTDGFQPIVFCRFIETAEYVAIQLRERLSKGIEVVAVTGLLPPADREERVKQLAKSPKRVLVSTDCLSEGVNLQEYFDAVMHYDLSWNPTRHEQREGRVDRFGQGSEKVRVVTYFGVDNQIDGIVVNVLIRKHRAIRNSIGISVPIPVDTNQIIEAVFEGLLLKEQHAKSMDEQLVMFEEYFKPKKEDLHKTMDLVAEREKRSRTMFAQDALSKNVDDVARELQEVQSAIGSKVDVARFVSTAVRMHGGTVQNGDSVIVSLRGTPRAFRESMGFGSNDDATFKARFEMPIKEGQLYLPRTHPIIEGLSAFVLDSALDPVNESVAARTGVIRSKKIQTRTTLLLLRLRYHIITERGVGEDELLAEDCKLVAFTGSPKNAQWLSPQEAEVLPDLESDASVSADVSKNTVRTILTEFNLLTSQLEAIAVQRGNEILESHKRVRSAARLKNVQHKVEPKLPVDVLGVYVYLPA